MFIKNKRPFADFEAIEDVDDIQQIEAIKKQIDKQLAN